MATKKRKRQRRSRVPGQTRLSPPHKTPSTDHLVLSEYEITDEPLEDFEGKTLRALAVKEQWDSYVEQQDEEARAVLKALSVRCYSAGQTILPVRRLQGNLVVTDLLQDVLDHPLFSLYR